MGPSQGSTLLDVMPHSHVKRPSCQDDLTFPSDPGEYTLDKQIGKGVSSTVQLCTKAAIPRSACALRIHSHHQFLHRPGVMIPTAWRMYILEYEPTIGLQHLKHRCCGVVLCIQTRQFPGDVDGRWVLGAISSYITTQMMK